MGADHIAKIELNLEGGSTCCQRLNREKELTVTHCGCVSHKGQRGRSKSGNILCIIVGYNYTDDIIKLS